MPDSKGKVYVKNDTTYISYTHKGKTITKQVPNRLTGLQILNRLDVELMDGKTFGEMADIWLKLAAKTCKETTVNDYRSILDIHILPVFGDRLIMDITRKEVINLLKNKLTNLSTSTVKHIKTTISNVFSTAIDEEIIEINPVYNLKHIFPKKEKGLYILNKLEIDLILKKSLEIMPDDYPIIALLAKTGLRLGEALALQWDNIDLIKKKIHVCQTYTRRRFTSTKTHEHRYVDMSDDLVSIISKAKKTSHFVFPGKNGLQPRNGDALRNKFKKVLKAANLNKGIRLHDLRHYYATYMINQKAPLAFVQKQLGHKSLSTTLEVYSHFIDIHDAKTINIIDE